MLVAILLIVVLILVLAPDIVVQPPPPHPVQESASRTRGTAVIVAGERAFPMQLQRVTGGTAFGDGVWYYRGADGGADNDSCCYLLEPREETNHCGRREEMVSSFEYKVPKNCVA